MGRLEREKVHISLEIQEATEETGFARWERVLGRRNSMEVEIKDF